MINTIRNDKLINPIGSNYSKDDICLMKNNTIVIRYNYKTKLFVVIEPYLLPFNLRNRFKNMIGTKEQDDKIFIRNISMVEQWLCKRILSMGRTNSTTLCNAIGVTNPNESIGKLKIALLSRAISNIDDFWIKLYGEKLKYEDVNLYDNDINSSIKDIAMYGIYEDVTLSKGKPLLTIEYTTQGAYTKAWYKHNDGNLYLHKKGNNGSYESKLEVMVSNILDKTNIQHLKYNESIDKTGEYVCTCKNMCSKEIGILHGIDFISYCNVNQVSPDLEMLRIDSDTIYKMWILDYIIANPDRHGLNWGFFYDLNSMELTKCHPLYDHNNSFNTDVMKDKNYKYIFNGKPMKGAAEYAISKVNIEIYDKITREDFMTDRQYECFSSRVKELGIKIN